MLKVSFILLSAAQTRPPILRRSTEVRLLAFFGHLPKLSATSNTYFWQLVLTLTRLPATGYPATPLTLVHLGGLVQMPSSGVVSR